jgi:hypothetical protein
MSHVRGYPLIAEALRRAGLDLPPGAEPPSKEARSSPEPVRARRPPRPEPPAISLGSPNGWGAKRAALWREQAGHCWWCWRETVLVEPAPKGGRLPPNAATVDHLRSRLDPARQIPPANGERRLVMACHACNTARGSKEGAEHDQLLGPQELWRRSGTFCGIAKMSGALNEVSEDGDRSFRRRRAK